MRNVAVAVCMGALDQACGTISVGNVKLGVLTENTGTALAICATQGRDLLSFDGHARIPIHCHALPCQHMYHTFTSGGIVLRWFRDKFCTEELDAAHFSGYDAYSRMSMLATSVPAGCEGSIALSHPQGTMAPEDNPRVKGVFYGFTLKHNKAHFIRAIMESIAFIAKRSFDAFEDIGIMVSEIRVLAAGMF